MEVNAKRRIPIDEERCTHGYISLLTGDNCPKCVEESKVVEHVLYRLFDNRFRLLYVGMTLDVAQRMNAHGRRDWWAQVEHITLERFESRGELAAAERRVIESEKPKYNVIYNQGMS